MLLSFSVVFDFYFSLLFSFFCCGISNIVFLSKFVLLLIFQVGFPIFVVVCPGLFSSLTGPFCLSNSRRIRLTPMFSCSLVLAPVGLEALFIQLLSSLVLLYSLLMVSLLWLFSLLYLCSPQETVLDLLLSLLYFSSLCWYSLFLLLSLFLALLSSVSMFCPKDSSRSICFCLCYIYPLYVDTFYSCYVLCYVFSLLYIFTLFSFQMLFLLLPHVDSHICILVCIYLL